MNASMFMDVMQPTTTMGNDTGMMIPIAVAVGVLILIFILRKL